ncbi:hypothetical protein SBA3_780002 [Candidatus Sulfopaludibacter sp. SbA3]|nr:hypothetical protein SBA3_780002 [Candidatus Sulfopaludibacter sp. SbA3]
MSHGTSIEDPIYNLGSMRYFKSSIAFLIVVCAVVTLAFGQTATPRRKRVLAWGDTLTAYQHDSISHALATMERLVRESGAFDTYIRTDSQWITKQPVPAPARNTRNLDYFDAIFFYGTDRRQPGRAAEEGPAQFHSRRWQRLRRRTHRRRRLLRLAGVRRDDRRLVRQSPVGRLRCARDRGSPQLSRHERTPPHLHHPRRNLRTQKLLPRESPRAGQPRRHQARLHQAQHQSRRSRFSGGLGQNVR